MTRSSGTVTLSTCGRPVGSASMPERLLARGRCPLRYRTALAWRAARKRLVVVFSRRGSHVEHVLCAARPRSLPLSNSASPGGRPRRDFRAPASPSGSASSERRCPPSNARPARADRGYRASPDSSTSQSVWGATTQPNWPSCGRSGAPSSRGRPLPSPRVLGLDSRQHFSASREHRADPLPSPHGAPDRKVEPDDSSSATRISALRA